MKGGAGDQAPQSVADQVLVHLDTLFNLARYLTGNPSDAQDLVQETCSRALRAADRFDGRDARAWLCRILRNAFVDLYRRQRRQATRGGLDTVQGDVEGPVDADLVCDDVDLDQIRSATSADLEAALLTLSEDARAVVLLDLEGLTESEVADVLGCSVGTVKSRLSRARTVLRGRLKDYAR